MPTDSHRLAVGVLAVLVVLGGAAVAYYYLPATAGIDSPPADGALVTVVDAETGAVHGRVTVEIADTFSERATGLSETPSLAPDEGMLFVYRTAGDHRFWMPNMSFPLDIVYVGADRRINSIHNASVPPPNASESEYERYPGHGKYVLEVNRGWMDDHGVTVGDRIEIEYGANATGTAAN